MDERGFTFFMVDSAGERRAFEIEYFPDEVAAADHARRILDERPRYRAVEVFAGSRSFQVERTAA